jgi:hypothetical protein
LKGSYPKMSKVYRHIPLAPDEYLGRVEEDGKVYETRPGFDHCVGRFDLSDGKIYETRLGPDKYLGRVDLSTGQVYLARLGPDEYIGKVRKNGHCYRQVALARDIYLGKVKDMLSFGHGGAAFLLLIYPKVEEIKAAEQKEAEDKLAGKSVSTAPKEA